MDKKTETNAMPPRPAKGGTYLFEGGELIPQTARNTDGADADGGNQTSSPDSRPPSASASPRGKTQPKGA